LLSDWRQQIYLVLVSVNETTLNGLSETDFEATMRTLEIMKSNLLGPLSAAGAEEAGEKIAAKSQSSIQSYG
jgi:hypothetical protein